MAHKEDQAHHIVPLATYGWVFFWLIVLTTVTVAASRIDFGAWNAVVAFAIATVKASMVLGYFMHLKYDNMMNRVIIASGMFFLIVLYMFIILDDFTRVFQDSIM
jgi:cytochrome c oxidase subunit IV